MTLLFSVTLHQETLSWSFMHHSAMRSTFGVRRKRNKDWIAIYRYVQHTFPIIFSFQFCPIWIQQISQLIIQIPIPARSPPKKKNKARWLHDHLPTKDCYQLWVKHELPSMLHVDRYNVMHFDHSLVKKAHELRNSSGWWGMQLASNSQCQDAYLWCPDQRPCKS